ncbi:hypothetical protein KBI52_10345 [Microvirga sp. HBU67558]|uniref:hypothetical protein n=1 Tax=Microvirga sp. HBU67558 TaxID=2824562 RepID=UPI001B35A453|nr:hypothetical protein [Microvirga sp. HBU67558]MBQ0820603.1 hypothetical protein [Microvirga sp. HBU67558]
MLTFMFKPIGGSHRNVKRQMERELERVYGKSLTRIIRKPASHEINELPLWIACPDYPVPKGSSERQSLRDVTVNDGRHMHADVVIPPWSRMKEDLATHFDEKQSHYVTADSALFRIDAVPITHDPNYVTGYVLKALRRGWVGEAEILVLPRSATELRDKAA